MSERLLIAAAVLVACAAGYLAIRAYVALRRRAILARTASLAEASTPEAATIVAFSSPACAKCRDQARAIDALESRLGEQVRVRKVDALEQPDLAERFGVMTLPTTVVLDAVGRPRAVNYGFAPEARLEAQVRELLATAPLAA